MGYEGHAVLIEDPEERAKRATEAMQTLSLHVSALRDAGHTPEIVSAGGTDTFDITGTWPGVTDVQAGSYVFMDGLYRTVRPDLGQPALSLLTTVISCHGPIGIIDAGLKSLTNEFGPPLGKDLPIKVVYLSEEHGHVALEGAELSPGDRVEVIPSHNDTTINLHSDYYVVQGEEVLDIWPIEAARAYR